jgi:predicted Holliday junction resolvase-like endonuclease
MDILQWIVIGVLVYIIYYLINKYEQRVNELTRLIELNRHEINKNKENIAKNRESIVKNAEGVAQNKETLDLNQAIIEKLK